MFKCINSDDGKSTNKDLSNHQSIHRTKIHLSHYSAKTRDFRDAIQFVTLSHVSSDKIRRVPLECEASPRSTRIKHHLPHIQMFALHVQIDTLSAVVFPRGKRKNTGIHEEMTDGDAVFLLAYSNVCLMMMQCTVTWNWCQDISQNKLYYPETFL